MNTNFEELEKEYRRGEEQLRVVVYCVIYLLSIVALFLLGCLLSVICP